jgi:hypothetical protein
MEIVLTTIFRIVSHHHLLGESPMILFLHWSVTGNAIALLVVLVQPVDAQQFSMSQRILLDNGEGNTMGWNPNGNKLSFTIFDNQFNPEI